MNINILEQEIILDKERAIYLPEHALVAISDLHLGKSAHFRQAGIQVPGTIGKNDLLRLGKILEHYQPDTLLITGDMFHHGLNADIEDFAKWREYYASITFLLVKGNHDRLSANNYAELGIQIHEPSYCLGPFCFIHDAPQCTEEELYAISGHIHPGVSVSGKAKQSLKFPCFYFGQEFAVLPAFSSFTGLSLIHPRPGDKVYAVTPGRVVAF